MDAEIERSVEEMYARARLSPSEPCGAVKLATAVLGEACVQYVDRGRLPGRAAVTCRAGVVIHLIRGLSLRELNHSAAHELGEWHLNANGYAGPDTEELVGQFAAALCVPRRAFHAGVRALGENIPALSKAFGVSQSLMVLRVGECLGRPTALITRNRIRTRGGRHDWPRTRGEWKQLVDRPWSGGLIVQRIHDAPGRVALVRA
jgi:hypothetical protein